MRCRDARVSSSSGVVLLSRVAACHDRRQRLVDFMRDRGGHLAHRRQLRNARELRLLRHFALARGGNLGKHVVERDRKPADLIATAVVDAQIVIPGLANGRCGVLEPLQRPHDVPMSHDGNENAEGGKHTGEAQAECHLSEQAVDPPPQQPVERVLGGSPRLECIRHGGRQGGIEGGAVADFRRKTACARA
jgi:hypothetical protein